MSDETPYFAITYRVKWRTKGSHGEAPFDDPHEAIQTANRRALLGFEVDIQLETEPVERSQIPTAFFWHQGL